jgi:hypothetical protein
MPGTLREIQKPGLPHCSRRFVFYTTKVSRVQGGVYQCEARSGHLRRTNARGDTCGVGIEPCVNLISELNFWRREWDSISALFVIRSESTLYS